jgi:hypothetical protein
VSQLNKKVEGGKVFTYMVIHDLKHPAESLIAQLKQQLKGQKKTLMFLKLIQKDTGL